MADQPNVPSNTETPVTYTVKLFQSHWARSNTEIFQVEATDSNDALKQAEAIAAEKGITENYDFEVERNSTDLSPEAAKAAEGVPAPAEEAAATDATSTPTEGLETPSVPPADNPVMAAGASVSDTAAADAAAATPPEEAKTISNDSSNTSNPLQTK